MFESEKGICVFVCTCFRGKGMLGRKRGESGERGERREIGERRERGKINERDKKMNRKHGCVPLFVYITLQNM